MELERVVGEEVVVVDVVVVEVEVGLLGVKWNWRSIPKLHQGYLLICSTPSLANGAKVDTFWIKFPVPKATAGMPRRMAWRMSVTVSLSLARKSLDALPKLRSEGVIQSSE